jgi:hypothetical protein
MIALLDLESQPHSLILNCLDIAVVNYYSFINMQKMTSDLFVLGYLRTLFQLNGIGRMCRKCEKNREELVVLKEIVTTYS